MNDRTQIELSIAALEGQRALLGDAVVDSSIAALREKLAAPGVSTLTDAELAGERKLVTVMFADMSGFTALSELLDPEEVRTLINACFSRLVPIIERYGGTVEKFIGDEIMAMFGAPVAHEDDVERALRAALEMLEALTEFNRERATTLGMHFGINTGTVVAGGLGSTGRLQYGVMGDTVNVAARLEDLSELGQVLVGPGTYRLAAGLFDFEPLPPVRPKGKSEPISVYRLLGLKPERGSTRGMGGLRSPLVGRTQELNALVDTVRNLATGGGAVVCIVAEPGLGKSRIVSEARSATGESVRWVEGRGLSHAAGTSHGVTRSVLDQLAGVARGAKSSDSSAALRSVCERYLGDASGVFPYLARLRDVPMDALSEATLKDLLPQTLQQRMRSAFADLIRAVARERSLALVVEDLHWADQSSLEVLESLLPLTESLPLLLLLAFRPLEGRTQEWYQRLMARAGDKHRALALAPLTPLESALLVENLLTIENMPAATRQLILDKSEGNPFFIEELLRSLIDAGMLTLTDRQAAALPAISQFEVPDTLQGVIAARIDSLPVKEKQALQTASVIGRVFQEEVLEQLLRQQRAEVALEPTLRMLLQRELIRQRSDQEYIFKHAVTRDVTYNSLLIARRKELHRAAAETIEKLYPEQRHEFSPSLAHHCEAAGLPEQAAGHFIRAGDRAQATYANVEAAAFYRSAIRQWDLVGDHQGLAKAYENLGMVLGLTAQTEEAIRAFETALTHVADSDHVSRARLYRRQGNAYNVQRRLSDMQPVYERALAELGPRSPASSTEWIDLQLDRIWLAYFQGRTDDVVVVLGESQRVIEAEGTFAQKAKLYESLVLLDLRRYRYFQLPDTTLAFSRQALHAARASDNRRVLGRALSILGFVHLWREELDEARDRFMDALKDVEAVGDVDTLLIILNYTALIGRKLGDVDMAREWAQRTLAQAEQAKNPFYRIAAIGSLAWVAIRTYNDDEARAQLSLALEQEGKLPSPIRFIVLAPALALEVKACRAEPAINLVRTLLHPSQQRMPAEVHGLLDKAVACWDNGDAVATQSLLEQALVGMRAQRMGYV